MKIIDWLIEIHTEQSCSTKTTNHDDVLCKVANRTPIGSYFSQSRRKISDVYILRQKTGTSFFFTMQSDELRNAQTDDAKKSQMLFKF